ncbi:MAG: hypothetical protein JW862_15535 [Anaerolineales bacterium]|nr:hypothetical protein [Anaerolineales bacterium]
MSLSPQRHTISFIIRIWAEYLEADPPGWRGVIKAVDTEQELVFSDLKEIAELIQQMIPIQKENPS